MYDVVIVGGGPAGLTAALYSARRSLRTLIISKDIGGQAATTTAIENYPGVGVVDGLELMQQFRNQAVQYGAEFVLGEVDQIERVECKDVPSTRDVFTFNVTMQGKIIQAKSVILAFGLTPRSLDVPGEKELVGKGVNYTTAPLLSTMHNKIAVVAGGGNSALEAVNELAEVCKKVYLVHRRDRFRAETTLVQKLEQHNNVEQVLNAKITEIIGDDVVTEVVIDQASGDTPRRVPTRHIPTNALFIHVGFMSKTGFIKHLVEVNEKNEVLIQPDCSTNTPGIFAAGDITTVNFKQVVVSAGEGCKAALTCYAYLMKQSGQEVKIDQDWVTQSKDHFIRT